MLLILEEYDFVHRIWRGYGSGEGLVYCANLCTTEVLHVEPPIYVDRGHHSDNSRRLLVRGFETLEYLCLGQGRAMFSSQTPGDDE